MNFFRIDRTFLFLALSMSMAGFAFPTSTGGAVSKAPISIRDQHTSLTKRSVLCQNLSGNLISEINSSTCISLLEDIGDQACSVSGLDVIMFMQVGDAAIFGVNAAIIGTASAPCKDVAAAAQSVINTCTDPSTGLLQGRAQVNGNPNLVVFIDSSHSSVPPCNPCF